MEDNLRKNMEDNLRRRKIFCPKRRPQKKNGNNLKKQYERGPKNYVLTQLERRPQNKIEDEIKTK